jgi:catechol 2,3-dioxygenase-like lactoylglutathione lyase family enzyme
MPAIVVDDGQFPMRDVHEASGARACQARFVIRLGTVVLGADDIDRAVAFWSAVLGYRPVHFADADGFTILVPPSGEGTRVAVQRSETPPEQHPRIHVDLVVDDDAEQAAEIERLLGLGATRVPWDAYPTDPDFVVLADPEGNRFCVVDASHGSKPTRRSA